MNKGTMVTIYRGERTYPTTTNRGTTHTPSVAMVRITHPTPYLPINHLLAHQRAKATHTPKVGTLTLNLPSPHTRTPQNKICRIIFVLAHISLIAYHFLLFSPVPASYALFLTLLQNSRCRFRTPRTASARLRALRTRYVYFWSRYAPFYVRSITTFAHFLHGKHTSMT